MHRSLCIALIVASIAGVGRAQVPDAAFFRKAINEACVKTKGVTDPVEKVESVEIPDGERKIPARLYRPKAEGPLPVLLFFHGGGFLAGNLDTHDNACRYLANRTPCLVLAVDYRLAPEHKFPAQPDDCYAALIWAAKNAAQFGGDPDRLAVAGDSSGGTLAATICHWTRDRKGPKLRAQVLINPVLDLVAEEQKLSDGMRFFIGSYLREPKDGAAASPLRASDFKGLPPTFVVVGETDELRAVGEAYTAKLRAVGVATNVYCHHGEGHLGPQWAAAAPAAEEALDMSVGFLRAAFRRAK